jgi:hypothetical protein
MARRTPKPVGSQRAGSVQCLAYRRRSVRLGAMTEAPSVTVQAASTLRFRHECCLGLGDMHGRPGRPLSSGTLMLSNTPMPSAPQAAIVSGGIWEGRRHSPVGEEAPDEGSC